MQARSSKGSDGKGGANNSSKWIGGAAERACVS
jgi:hypothetical protein